MSNVKRFSLAIIVLVLALTIMIGVSHKAQAATVCSPATAISVPFAKDGAGDFCYQAASLCSYINSWNLTTLEVNGTVYTNLYVAASSIAPLNGGYTIHYNSAVTYGHFEVVGTCATGPTSTPATPATSTKTNTPVTPAGATATRTRTSTTGPTATRTRTSTTGPSLTPTRTNTQGTPVAVTKTPTGTPTCACGITSTPTKTPTIGIVNTPTKTPTLTIDQHLSNPFNGANFYVNKDWKGSATYNVGTFVWLDSIDAVNGGTGYAHSLAGHLDAALAQGANAVGIVLYDIPNRDCAALVSNGDLLIDSNGFTRYETEFIGAIYNVISQVKYSNLRIIAVIEPNSLANLVTNLSYAKCTQANDAGGYVQSIQYALNKLHPLNNFYAYVDIGYSGWLGWATNFAPAVTLFSNTILGTTYGGQSVDGFISNTANYGAAVESFLSANTTIGGNPVRSASFFQWADYIDEASFDAAWKTAMLTKGIRSSMLIDTSRNGWGGCGGGPYALQTCRPTATSTSTDLETYVNASRIDRRPTKSDWCNQNGAGIGALPATNPGNGYDAYVWVKSPGESDGSSSLISTGPDNPRGRVFDNMCDPNYLSNINGNLSTNALPNAPVFGNWFQAQFDQLVANKYP